MPYAYDAQGKVINVRSSYRYIGRNGSINNIHNVEKAMLKFQQLAKDAQSNGDPVLAQNYLQHADHYLRRFNELNDKKVNLINKTAEVESTISQGTTEKN